MSARPKVHICYIALYPSDFLADVAHLGNTELGIYWRLLLMYYQHRKPLPWDEDKLFRIAMALTPEEQACCRNVVSQFFCPAEYVSAGDTLTCYRHKRADKEIRAAEDRYLANFARTEPARDAKKRKLQAQLSSVTESVTSVVTTSEPEPEPENFKTSAPDGAPVDASVWNLGIAILRENGGVKEDSARRFLGSLRKDWPDAAVEEAVRAAVGATNPRAYILGVLKSKPKKGGLKVAI